MNNFVLMLQFLTRIPINHSVNVNDDSFKKGSIYFPLIGLIIGLIEVAVFISGTYLFTKLIAIILAIAANIAITGALHIDGLADTCDGIYSSRSKDRMLEIMKDSRIGVNGALAILFDLALRISILLALNTTNILLAFVVSTVVSRSMLILLARVSKYAREGKGLGTLLIGQVSLITVLLVIFEATILISIILKIFGIVIILLTALLMLVFNKYIKSKIDGMTGDTLGAAVEISEIFVLMIFVFLQKSGVL